MSVMHKKSKPAAANTPKPVPALKTSVAVGKKAVGN